MIDANVNKKEKKRRVLVSLSEVEQVKLKSMVTGYGNMVACEDATGKTRNMIQRAAAGMKLLPENIKPIRAFINGEL